MSTIDLNSDLGEGFGQYALGNDAAMLDVVSSANIACGFHAGDPTVMRRTTELAAARGVRIGAHVSYRDLAGFGRRFIDVDPVELADDVTYQIAALDGFARAAGSPIAYVKPHGALYNTIGHHREQAAAVVAGIARYRPGIPVLGLPDSLWLALAAEAGLPTYREAFTDRGYRPDGTLVPRGHPGAVLTDPAEVGARSVRIAVDGSVIGSDGGSLRTPADSLCVHGDTPGALELARAVRRALLDAGVDVVSFTDRA